MRWFAGWSLDTFLDDSIAAYRRGAELARFCQMKLASAEQEIKRLEGDLLKPVDLSCASTWTRAEK